MRNTKRRRFGNIRALPSGRQQARWACPTCEAMHPAHTTFDTKGDAETYLDGVRTDIVRQVYVCPVEQRAAAEATRKSQRPFRDYATRWLSDRTHLKPRTRMLYQRQLDRDLLPGLGDLPLTSITRDVVDDWWRDLRAEHTDRPTGNAHAYSLLRTILGSAVKDERIAVNPCRVEKVRPSGQRRQINTATDAELDDIAAAMPDQYALAVHLAAYCALRFGELVELRRRDVDLADPELAAVAVSRAMVHREGQTIVGTPKSAQGGRLVHVPPHLRVALVNHIEEHAQPGPDGLLFHTGATGRACGCGHKGCRGGHLLSSALYRVYMPAREAAGRPDLRWHDLRHTGAVEAARQGATLAETMARLGHSTVAAAMRYQHATKERDAELARRLSSKRLSGQHGREK